MVHCLIIKHEGSETSSTTSIRTVKVLNQFSMLYYLNINLLTHFSSTLILNIILNKSGVPLQ